MKYALMLATAGMLVAAAPANKAEAMPVDLGITQANTEVNNFTDVQYRRYRRFYGPRIYSRRYYAQPYPYAYPYAYPYYQRPFISVSPFGFRVW